MEPTKSLVEKVEDFADVVGTDMGKVNKRLDEMQAEIDELKSHRRKFDAAVTAAFADYSPPGKHQSLPQ